MKIIAFSRNYISKNGNPVFVHTFSATDAELASLVERGCIFRKDDAGVPICFLQEKVSPGTALAISKNGKLYPQVALLKSSVQSKLEVIQAFMHSGLSLDKVAQLAFGNVVQES